MKIIFFLLILYGILKTLFEYCPVGTSIGVLLFICLLIYLKVDSIVKQKQRTQENLEKEKLKKIQKYDLLLKYKQDSSKLIKELYKNVIFLVLQNFKTLDIKYRQNVFKDDYGNDTLDAWNKEISYFVEKVLLDRLPRLMKEMNGTFLLFCSDIQMTFTFPQKVDINNIDKYTTCFEFNFISKDKQVVKMTKKYIESHMDAMNLWDIESIIETIQNWSKFNSNPQKYIKSKGADFSHKALKLLSDREIFVINYNFLTQKESLVKIVNDIYMQIKDHVFSSADNLNISNISPYDFEKKCAEILQKMSYEVQVTKGSGDQGVDVIAQKKHKVIAIQCKKYTKPVGNKAVQEVIAGKDYYGADYAVVVSNASYTPAARKLASKCNVLLLNIKQLEFLDDYLH